MDTKVTKENLQEFATKFVNKLKRLPSPEKFVDNLQIDSNSFLSLYDSGYTSLQGLCVIDNKYMVVVRYCGTNNKNRSFRVYDIINKTYLTESIFTDAQVGHCNSICYDDGYIYVATLTTGAGVVRLIFDEETKEITYDSVVYAGGINVKSVGVHDGEAYIVSAIQNGVFKIYITNDFSNFEVAFETDFNGVAANITPQGITYDGQFLYIAFSGLIPYTMNNDDLVRRTEKIFICDTTGNILKCLTFERSAHGEIEDVDVVTINRQTYIAIGVNQNDRHASNVYVIPLYKATTPVLQFDTAPFTDQSFYNHDTPLHVYVDSANGTPFADGTQRNPFKTISEAIAFIKKANVPAEIFITGTFESLTISYVPVPITLNLYDCTVTGTIKIKRCAPITIDRTTGTTGATVKFLQIEETVVFVRAGISTLQGIGSGSAISLLRAELIGNMGAISNYANAVSTNSSICLVNASSISVSGNVVVSPSASLTGMAVVNGQIYGPTLSQ